MTTVTATCALILCLGACAQPNVSSGAAPTSSTKASTPGVLTGLVRLYGGPMNPETGKQALNGSPGANWTVKVLSGSEVVAKDKSDASGRFRFRLAPGRYTLGCGQEPSVVVEAGQTVSVSCRVPVP